MEEFRDIHHWLAATGGHRHEIVRPSTLPTPTFELDGRTLVNHVSIREGIKLSGASRVAYRHCDMASLSG